MPGWVSSHLVPGIDEHLEMDACIACSSQQELSIKLSKLVVDLNQRSIFFLFCRLVWDDRNTEETQMGRNEINFGDKRQILRDPSFQVGHLPNRYLECWETFFCCRVSVCVSLCVCVTDLGKSQPQEEMLKNLKGQGRERQGQELSPWVPPLPLLCCVTFPLPPGWASLFSPVDQWRWSLRYHPNQKCCNSLILRVGSTGPSKALHHNVSIYLYLCLPDLSILI